MFPLNVPNVLTLLRILLVPVLVVALLSKAPNGSALAAGVFALAAITDGLDGYIARSRRVITTFGKVMDPIADKLLIAAALITLVGLNRVAAWVAMIIIAREFAVSGLRVAAGQQGVVIPASPLGKLKTVVQVAAIFAVIATGNHGAWWAQVLLYISVAVTVVSGADYFLNFRRRIEEAREKLVHETLARERARTRRAGDLARTGLGLGRQPREQLLDAGAADVERAVEGLAVHADHGEQHVDGRGRGGAALGREPARGQRHVGHRVLAERPRAQHAHGVRLSHRRERSLADAQRLQRGAHLAVQPQEAHPALGLVLAGCGERDCRVGQGQDDRGVL